MSNENRLWVLQARCADETQSPPHPDDWYQHYDPNMAAARLAQRRLVAFCQSCPVRAECLEDALVNDPEWGIRAGLTVEERKKLAEQRQIERRRTRRVVA